MVIAGVVVMGVALLGAVLAGVATRVPALERPVRASVGAVEALVAAYVVADLGLVLRADEADRPASMLTHVGYAVAAVGLLPLLVWRRPPVEPGSQEATGEDTEVEPASLWVVVVALVAVAVCVLRLAQTR